MKYSDLKALKRGDIVQTKRVVYTFTSPSHGVGMGEQPESITVAFENGAVLYGDEWSSNIIVLHNPFGAE